MAKSFRRIWTLFRVNGGQLRLLNVTGRYLELMWDSYAY